MATNNAGSNTAPMVKEKLSAVIYGSYFVDELLPHLDQAARMREDITPEWHPEQKHCYMLDLNETFNTIDILHSDQLEGPIHDWNMGYILQRQPDIVVLNAGEPELCDKSKSLFHVASYIMAVARKLVGQEYNVKRVVCVGAIPLVHGVPYSESKYRKRVFGMNAHLAHMAQSNIVYRFPNAFWKDENKNRVTPSMYAPSSFIPGPDPASIWYKKYVKFLRSTLVDSASALGALLNAPVVQQ